MSASIDHNNKVYCTVIREKVENREPLTVTMDWNNPKHRELWVHQARFSAAKVRAVKDSGDSAFVSQMVEDPIYEICYLLVSQGGDVCK